MTTPDTTRTPGRPRSSQADRAILAATLRLLVEQGYDAMSIESVAATAGVGKTTIYRRYPGKRELVVAAVSSIAEASETLPDCGNVRADLLVYFRQLFEVFQTGIAFAMLGTLLVRERDDPALMELFRRQIIAPRMEALGVLFRRGIERGELRADSPILVAVQMLAGSVFARHVSGYPGDGTWMEALIDTLLQGLAVRPESTFPG